MEGAGGGVVGVVGICHPSYPGHYWHHPLLALVLVLARDLALVRVLDLVALALRVRGIQVDCCRKGRSWFLLHT